eukprot:3601302-Amphidinium_carterae.3
MSRALALSRVDRAKTWQPPSARFADLNCVENFTARTTTGCTLTPSASTLSSQWLDGARKLAPEWWCIDAKTRQNAKQEFYMDLAEKRYVLVMAVTMCIDGKAVVMPFSSPLKAKTSEKVVEHMLDVVSDVIKEKLIWRWELRNHSVHLTNLNQTAWLREW